MSSFPLPTSDGSSTNNTATADGLTFIDNSDLSVCEKIKLYFAQNYKPAYKSLNSPNSSDSTVSPDFDASFNQMLEETRRRKKNIQSQPVDFNLKELGSDLLMDDSTIDLCSSPESLEDLVVRGSEIEVSPNLSAFNGTLFGANDPRQQTASRQLKCNPGGDGYDSDDSLGVAELNETLVEKCQEDQVPWYREESDADSSFLEHELQCQRDAEEEEDRLANLSCVNETQLFDTEAPSMLWDQTIVDGTLPLFPMGKTNIFRSRPSTIAEESTINSTASSKASNSSSTKNQSKVNVFSKKMTERSFKHTPAALSSKPFEAAKIQPAIPYRESSVNVFPKKKTRNLFEPQTDLPPSPAILLPKPNQKSQPLTPTPLFPTSTSQLNTRKDSPKPPIKPKPKNLSPHRKSLALMTFDDTICDENQSSSSFDHEDDDDDDDSVFLNTARQFNDTIEAMDFFMDKGHKLLQSAAKKPPPAKPSSPPSPLSPNLMNFSPKNIRTTPDTIRRRILMRNLLRSSDSNKAAVTSSGGVPKFSHEEMMVRRSVRRADDSFDD